MKKIIAMFLSLLMVLMILPMGLAEEAAPLTTLDIVKQLKNNHSVEDIWVPVLPQQYVIKDFTVNDDGTYVFYVKNQQENATKMQSIAILPLTVALNETTIYSGYQYYLLQQGISSYPVSQEIVDGVIAKKKFTWNKSARTRISVSYKFARPLAEYQNYPTAHLYFDYTKRVDGDIGFSSVHEMIMGIHSQTIASVIYDYTPPAGTTSIPQDVWIQTVQDDMAVEFVTCGDADGNKKVNAVDALTILKHEVQKAPITDELSLLLADFDGNGTVNASDALLTLRKVVGKPA